MEYDINIRNDHIVNMDERITADIMADKGKIIEVSDALPPHLIAKKEINASEHYIRSGLIDLSVCYSINSCLRNNCI